MKRDNKEIEQILKGKFCLGCSKSCDLLYPNCHNGLNKAEELIEDYYKEKDLDE